ncbi:hypothetical protein M8818_005331 [Zalaria obscura]|uniref:Uncharacterized protein n=1 Tax=Zalaria obscura TaxID=2024903 RepID=A0ACC3SB15_9PEZI
MRGNAGQTKIHYKGKDDDFIVFAESAQDVRNWKEDKTVPLAQVVNGWKIFVTHKQGAQGIMDSASKGSLESEFGTHKEDDVIAQILEKGTIVESEESGRNGSKNDNKGSMVGGSSSGVHG